MLSTPATWLTADLSAAAVVELPAPALQPQDTLLRALLARRTQREFSRHPLPIPVLSSLLWAACGINRTATGGRTAPSAREWHEIDVYAAMTDGLYLYDPDRHVLIRVLDRDIRIQTGLQPFVADAPLNLLYVADRSRMVEASEQDRLLYAAAEAGCISQNVSLYCAATGLATVVRGLVPRTALANLMGLKTSQRVILAQSAGYPGAITPG